MATTVSVNTGFTGALAGELILQAFKKADTIAKQAINVLPNVVGSGYLPKLSYSAGLSAASCGFSPTGNVGYDEKEVATKKFKVEHELCKDEFSQTFAAQAAGLFSAHEEIPATITEGILQLMVDNLSAIIDQQIWSGDNSSTQFNGLLRQFNLDAAVIDVSGSAITKSTVLTELDKVYSAIPAEIEDSEDLVWVVSNDIAKAYKQNQAEQGLNTSVGDKELDYLGLPLTAVKGLPAATMLVYRRKNVCFLTGLESDMNEVKVVDLDESDLSGKIRTKIQFTAGVGYSFGGEIVYSKIR
jgi:hypothetical protein